jgi:tRNA (adenine-N(1)-)-methyltransferase non-catalytic subunit
LLLEIKSSKTVSDSKIIKEGDKVILVSNGGKMNLVKVKGRKKFKIANFFIAGDEMIGCTYGTILEKVGNRATVKKDRYTLDQDHHTFDLDTVINADNREIDDRKANQNLWYEEIEFKKSKGITGQELIDNIVENSNTFTKRSKFSQEKYLKKLKKKHLFLAELRYPSMHNVCDYAYDAIDNRSVKLRYDALAYILNTSNVTCTSKALIIENTKGIVTAGAVERMGDRGTIFKLCLSDSSIANYQTDISFMYKMNEVNGTNITFVNYRDFKRKSKSLNLVHKQMQRACTSCIIVHDKHSPKDLFALAYPFLQPSCYVVVHSESLQPLAELERHVRNNKFAVMVNLEELFTREYQVLPLRTHPHMATTSSSGYILTFITIEMGA